MPSQWYDELIHTFFVKAVIDLTPLDGKFAWQCILNRVGYIGIAFTTEHESQLVNRLKAMYKLEMSKAGSALFNVQYAKAIGEETTTLPPVPKPKPRPKRKAKAKAKASVAPEGGGHTEDATEGDAGIKPEGSDHGS